MSDLKKKSKKPVEVLVNVGLMYLCGDTLKPVSGKTLPVRTVTTINKVQLLEKSIDKHAAHDRAFAPYQGYTLIYPDGKEIFTIPGNPTESFFLERERGGKPYNRITLYLALRSDLHASYASDSAAELNVSGEPAAMKEISQKKKIGACLSHPSDTSQTTLCEMSNLTKIGACLSCPSDTSQTTLCEMSNSNALKVLILQIQWVKAPTPLVLALKLKP